MQSVQNETMYEMGLTTEEVLELARSDVLRVEAVMEAAREGLPVEGETDDSWLTSQGITIHTISLTKSGVAGLAEGRFHRILAMLEAARYIAEKEGLDWLP